MDENGLYYKEHTVRGHIGQQNSEKDDFSRNLLMFQEKMNCEEHNQPFSGSS
jgi:hypothetical protein